MKRTRTDEERKEVSFHETGHEQEIVNRPDMWEGISEISGGEIAEVSQRLGLQDQSDVKPGWAA